MARPIVVTSAGGDADAIEIGEHRLVVDQPVKVGGTDSGPTPTELFVAGLAGCVAYYGGKYLRSNGLPTEVTVRVRYKWALPPTRLTRIQLSVEAPGLTVEHAAGFREAIGHCSVHNSLVEPPTVEIELAADTTASGR
jgi:putative redox protein